MFREIRRGILFTIATLVVVGAYHVVLWGIGQAVFPMQANGSLIRGADGTVVGSALIAQKFTDAKYFHPRPSAVDYNAASTGASNYGPSNPDHLKAVRKRIVGIETEEGVGAAEIPSEMVTTSGGGLDPDIPPNAAELQAPRVALARQVPVDRVLELVRHHTEQPAFGFLGRARVNVLELNLALDRTLR